MKYRFCLALIVLLLSSCAAPAGAPAAPAAAPAVAGEPLISAPPVEPGAVLADENSTPGEGDGDVLPLQPAGSPTPDLRPKPEEWRDWPVVPTLSPAMRAVYRKGLEMGNRPEAFSKVGDCQNICEAFLCLYDQPGAYKLNNKFTRGYPQPDYHTGGGDFPYLQDTIDAFAGSWGRESMAVEGGFNFPAIFSPLRADPAQCKPGETPLVCEVRLHKPSFIIIGMEYWYKGRTAENYENYLRKTVAYALERGIVPILEAKADNKEGDHSINLATARVAYEYDLPFWNFWRAVQAMPDSGMDTRRDHADGFHISYDAQLVRSFSALQVLDSLRRSLEAPAGVAAVFTPTPGAADESGGAVVKTEFELNGTCPPEGGLLVFNTFQSEVSGVKSLDITQVDTRTETWTQVSGDDLTLLGAAPRGCRVLLAADKHLYTAALDGSEAHLLSEAYASESERGALWITASDEIAYIASGEDGLPQIWLSAPDGSEARALPVEDLRPVRLYASPDGSHLFWESGRCTGDTCTPAGARVTFLDKAGYPSRALEEGVVPLGAPASGVFAYTGKGTFGEPRLMVSDAEGAAPLRLEVSATHHAMEFRPPTHLLQYAWSPDGKRLSVIATNRSTYSGRKLEDRYFVISADNKGNFILPPKLGSDLLVSAWSPDGAEIVFGGVAAEQDGAHLTLEIYNMDSRRITTLSTPEGVEIPEDAFVYPGEFFWVTAGD